MKMNTWTGFMHGFEAERKRLGSSLMVCDRERENLTDGLFDRADIANSEMATEMNVRLGTRRALYLKKVEAAVHRIREGSFGRCEDCGEGIDMRRLRVRPTASLCIGCKRESEEFELACTGGMRRSASYGGTGELCISDVVSSDPNHGSHADYLSR
jgi:DnaK suppressor protein